MLSKAAVLKAIIECMNEEHNAMLVTVRCKLDCDDFSLIPLLDSLNSKHYTIQTSTYDIHITDLGIAEYHKAYPSKSEKTKRFAIKLSYNFTKFTFQRLVDIGAGIIIGVAASAIAHHFGWQ
jgi:hypothetical protein